MAATAAGKRSGRGAVASPSASRRTISGASSAVGRVAVPNTRGSAATSCPSSQARGPTPTSPGAQARAAPRGRGRSPRRPRRRPGRPRARRGDPRPPGSRWPLPSLASSFRPAEAVSARRRFAASLTARPRSHGSTAPGSWAGALSVSVPTPETRSGAAPTSRAASSTNASPAPAGTPPAPRRSTMEPSGFEVRAAVAEAPACDQGPPTAMPRPRRTGTEADVREPDPRPPVVAFADRLRRRAGGLRPPARRQRRCWPAGSRSGRPGSKRRPRRQAALPVARAASSAAPSSAKRRVRVA